jgi:hypothetical protein
MSQTPNSPSLPIWPSGMARLADGILEVTTGEGIRVAAADITEIGIDPPRAGRLSLTLAYRAGLGKHTTGYWVEAKHAAALRHFVECVRDLVTPRAEIGEVLGHRVISV